jgi:hypothetical protein
MGSALSPARCVTRDGRKFFSDIMHVRIDCEEMIRRT